MTNKLCTLVLMIFCALGLAASAQAQTAAPTFSLASGTYSSNQALTITDSTSGSTTEWCYVSPATAATCVPGTTATGVVNQAYTGTIAVGSSVNICATATSGASTSSATCGAYVISSGSVATPTFGTAGGTYSSAQSTTILDATSGASLAYCYVSATTATSCTPNVSGTGVTSGSYTGAIYIGSSIALCANATLGGVTSSVACQVYTISTGGGSSPSAVTAAAVTISPNGGSTTSAETVTLSDSVAGSTIYYTLDGSTPNPTSTTCTAPCLISVATSETVTAVAQVLGSNNQNIHASASGWKIVTPTAETSNGITSQAGGGVGSNEPSSFNMTFGSTMNESLSTTASSGETQGLFVYSGSGCDNCSTITETKTFEPTQGASYIANNEIDMYQNDATRNILHMFGLQCNQQAGYNQWQIDNEQGSWMNTGITAGCPNSTTTATTVTFEGHWVNGDTACGGNGCSYFDALTINGVRHLLNTTVYVTGYPAGALANDSKGWASVCGLQDQIDLTNTGTSGANPTTAGRIVSNESLTCGYATSSATAAAFTLTAPPALVAPAVPTLSLNGGTYSGTQLVTLSDATSGASIYYTTNGSTPTTSSTLYTVPISVTGTETIEVIAGGSGFSNSASAYATYTITPNGNAQGGVTGGGSSGNSTTSTNPSGGLFVTGAGMTTVYANRIMDAGGSLLASGTATFTVTDASGNPISPRYGTGGQIITRPAPAQITNGAFTMNLADVSQTMPNYFCYAMVITDNTSGDQVAGGSGYNCLQPYGATYSLDNYAYSTTPIQPPTTAQVVGDLSLNGNIYLTGNLYGNIGTIATQSVNTVNEQVIGSLGAKVLNGVQNVAAYPGNDLSVQVAAALTACGGTGTISGGFCEMFIPAGNYTYTSTLHIPLYQNGGIRLTCDPGAVINYTGNSDAIVLDPVGFANARTVVENCRINGTANAVSGIHTYPTNMITIRNNQINGFSNGDGILVEGSNVMNVEENVITNNKYGIEFVGTYCVPIGSGATSVCGLNEINQPGFIGYAANAIHSRGNHYEANQWGWYSDQETKGGDVGLNNESDGDTFEGNSIGGIYAEAENALSIHNGYFEAQPHFIVLGNPSSFDGYVLAPTIFANHFTGNGNQGVAAYDMELNFTTGASVFGNSEFQGTHSQCMIKLGIGYENQTYVGQNYVQRQYDPNVLEPVVCSNPGTTVAGVVPGFLLNDQHIQAYGGQTCSQNMQCGTVAPDPRNCTTAYTGQLYQWLGWPGATGTYPLYSCYGSAWHGVAFAD